LENQEEILKRKETKLVESKNKLKETNTDLEKELDKLKRDLHYYKQLNNEKEVFVSNSQLAPEQTVQVEFE